MKIRSIAIVATLAAIASARPSLILLVPATIQALIEHPHWSTTDISSLRAMSTGSTQVPQKLVDAFAARGIAASQALHHRDVPPPCALLSLASLYSLALAPGAMSRECTNSVLNSISGARRFRRCLMPSGPNTNAWAAYGVQDSLC